MIGLNISVFLYYWIVLVGNAVEVLSAGCDGFVVVVVWA